MNTNKNVNNLSTEYFIGLGKKLGCDPAALKAVQMVESGGRMGFLESGRPQILFEGQIFYRQLKDKFGVEKANQVSSSHPNICYPTWNKSKYLGGENEWKRLEEARSIDEYCANMSASWGMFQVMGFNYHLCGCKSLGEFVTKMSTSQQEQMNLASVFLEKSGCLSPLRSKNWALFAKKYNGPGYAQNKYDIKLAKAYEKAKKDGYKS